MNEAVLKNSIEYIKRQRPSLSLVYDFRINKFIEQSTQDMYEGYCASYSIMVLKEIK